MGVGGGACYLVWGVYLTAVSSFLPLPHMDSSIRDDSLGRFAKTIWLKMNSGFSKLTCLHFRDVTGNFPSLKSKSHQLFSDVFKYFV